MEIIALILSNPSTLIYSQSGVGKTSLMNTKITYELEEQYQFQTFPSSARVRSLLSPDKLPKDIKNLYMFNALQSLKPNADLEELKNDTLSSFLKRYEPKTNNEEASIPKLIIFDQLEEIFSLYPENWYEQQQEFFRQVAEALNKDNMLRIVFVIREEYLAHLYSFAHLIPGRLRAHFRLERLSKEAAFEAITQPLKHTGSISFAPGVAEKLINDLLTMRVENIFGKIVDMKGEYVEPVYLQVVCQRLWLKIISSGITEITLDHLKHFADVNQALTEFYLDTISYASKETHIKEDIIRNWVDEKLITPSGTRGIVHREVKLTGGLPNKIVDVLQQRYLIRQEWRAGYRWYELTHDRLIGPIRESNKEWKEKKNKKFIQKVTLPQLEEQIQWYSQKSFKNKFLFRTSQIIILIVGATIPIANLIVYPDFLIGIISSIISIILTLLIVMSESQKYYTRWMLYRNTTELLVREKYYFQNSADRYTNLDDEEKNRFLLEKIEYIKQQTSERYAFMG